MRSRYSGAVPTQVLPIETAAPQGLSAALAAQRLKAEGYNELPTPDRRGVLRILPEVIRQPMFALLSVAASFTCCSATASRHCSCCVCVACRSAITIVQESRSERVLEALRESREPARTRDPRWQRVQHRRPGGGAGDLHRRSRRATASPRTRTLLAGARSAARRIAAHRRVGSGAESRGRALRLRRSDRVVPGRVAKTARICSPARSSCAAPGQARVHATGVRSEMGKIGRALRTIETEQPHLQVQMQWLVRVTSPSSARSRAG